MEPYKKFPQFPDSSEDQSERNYLSHKMGDKKPSGQNAKLFDPEK